QGDTENGSMYLIVSGKAETSIQRPGQKEKVSILEHCVAGDILGCSAFIEDEKRAVMVTAITELHLMPIDGNAPGIWSKRFPDFKEAAETRLQQKQELLKKSIDY
ncbi:MAG: cyclic nucleotide-binding domain-containing protein, partial [Mariprofundaceae bacterium]